MATVSGVKAFYEKRKTTLWVALALLPALTVGAGLVVANDVFYDHYVWRDIYGPLLVDARQWSGACLLPDGEVYESTAIRLHHDAWWARLTQPTRTAACERGGVGAVDGYTPLSEATYGYALGVILYGIFVGIFRKYNVKTDAAWVAALMPYILLGPVTRALEDADLFQQAGGGAGAFSILFISPVIYMHIALYTIFFLALGVFLERRQTAAPRNVLAGVMGLALAAEVTGYWAITDRYPNEMMAAAPVWVVAVAAALGFLWYWRAARAGTATVNTVLLAGGLPLIAPALYLIARWMRGPQWVPGWTGRLMPEAGAQVLALALTVTALVALAAWGLRRAFPAHAETFGAYLAPLSLAIVFAHMLDAFATYVAMFDPFNLGPPLGQYGEKHPVSQVFLDIGNGLGFPAVKLLLVVGAIYLLDKESKRGTPDDARLVGIITMAVLVLGFAPGLRSMLRVMMGV